MLDELLQWVKGYLSSDVEATIVHVADPVVLHSFPCVVVQIPDWQRVWACNKREVWSQFISSQMSQ